MFVSFFRREPPFRVKALKAINSLPVCCSVKAHFVSHNKKSIQGVRINLTVITQNCHLEILVKLNNLES